MTEKIVLASNNLGKLKEFNLLLTPFKITVLSQKEFTSESIEETGLTFVENAILKARFASKKSGLPALADDSGIEVDYLKGQPGIYSARFSKEGTDVANNQKLLDLLKEVPDEKRTARYRCVLVYLRHEFDPSPVIAQGSLEGFILREPIGDHGFGYDPVFWLPEHQKSAAELTLETKNKISHRSNAFNQLIKALEV